MPEGVALARDLVGPAMESVIARLTPDVVAYALEAGCRWVSLREKDLPQDEQILLARTLLPMVRAHGAKLMLHGEAELAKLAGIDGVHLPRASIPFRPAR